MAQEEASEFTHLTQLERQQWGQLTVTGMMVCQQLSPSSASPSA